MAVILVVDDEGPIQQLISRILERQGHRVITCGDASAALALTDNFDLLIVDFVLPNMNGRDLTAEMLQFALPGEPRYARRILGAIQPLVELADALLGFVQ